MATEDNFLYNLMDVENLIQRIDNIRRMISEQYKNGIIPDNNVMNVLGNSIHTITEMLASVYILPEAEQISNDLCHGIYSDMLDDQIVKWEDDVNCFISYLMSSSGRCNLCGKDVIYLFRPRPDQNDQEIQKCLYANRIYESESRQKCKCPECQAIDRERMIALFIDLLQPEENQCLNLLHIAPSEELHKWLLKKEYIQCDTSDPLLSKITSRNGNLSPDSINDATYDIIICSYVLDQIEDDKAFLHTLHRILKPDGICLFLVPLLLGLDKTIERTSLSKEDAFQYWDNEEQKRLYATEDFLNRLSDAGYLVHILGKEYFDEDAWNQAGLSDIHYLYAATKTDIGIGVEPYQPASSQPEALVSVVMPSYNRGYFIERAIKSVLNQTYQNFELIIVDDASTDNTEEVIKSINDKRIRYIKLEQNSGANHARNIGIQSSNGSYIAFNDSDVEWLPEKLEKQMKLMKLEEKRQGNKIGVIYCRMAKYEGNNLLRILPEDQELSEAMVGNTYLFMLRNMFIDLPSALIRKDVFEHCGYFNENLKRLQDWELFLRIAKQYHFSLVQDILIHSYLLDDCISKNTRGWLDTVMYVFELHDIVHTSRLAYQKISLEFFDNMQDYKKQYPDSDDYINGLFTQIERHGYFTKSDILQKKQMLGIATANTESYKKEKEVPPMELKQLYDRIDQLDHKLNEINQNVTYNDRMLNELLWAQVFNSARCAFPWLDNNLALWPGRWGVGYQYMYVVSRYLNEVQPKSILETGLGQSTRLISSYIKWLETRQECSHLVIEHDADWIKIFENDFAHGTSTRIVQRNLTPVEINQQSKTYVYQNLGEMIQGKKFDFISLDGPYGTNEPDGFSRIDILNFLPECLNSSFCIILDDYERYGEKNTVKCIKAKLQENHIPFCEAVYRGTNDMYLLASADLQFLCTL